eukprot:1196324-Prorocentrum_minimum.AAC.6
MGPRDTPKRNFKKRCTAIEHDLTPLVGDGHLRCTAIEHDLTPLVGDGHLRCQARPAQPCTSGRCAGNYIQGTFREHSGNIQGTFRNIRGTFKEHSGNTSLFAPTGDGCAEVGHKEALERKVEAAVAEANEMIDDIRRRFLKLKQDFEAQVCVPHSAHLLLTPRGPLDPTHTQRAVVGTLHRRRTSEYSSPRPIASPYPQVKNAERRFEAEKEKAKKWALQATGMTDAVAKAKDFKQNLEQAKKDREGVTRIP